MIPSKYLYCCLLFILTGNFIFSQTQIKGTVEDSLAAPVVRANILLFQEEALVSYTFSSVTGEYSFSGLESGNYTIKATSMGYKKAVKQLSLEPIKENIVAEVNFVLDYDYDPLEEIVLKVERDIEIRQDTIIFKADSFKLLNDVVLEDLLKNIPGIQVSDAGVVQFQGKPITKIKIENDDLFEGGYQVLTKNLNSNIIDKVQVLQNYSDNALLKGVQVTDDVALNLTLKEDRKSSLFGNASTGYGTNERHHLKANLISFLDRSKFYFIGNANNVGHNPAGEIAGLINPQSFSSDNTRNIGSRKNATTFIDINTKRPLLGDQISNLNNAKFGSLNWIYNFNKDIKIKGLIVYSGDQKDFISNETTRFLTEDPFVIQENYNIRRNENLYYGKVDMLWNINENSSLDYSGILSGGIVGTFANLLQNSTHINEDLSFNNLNTNHLVSFTNKIKDSSALVITGRYIDETRPQIYNVTPYTYGGRFANGDELTGSIATSENRMRYAGLLGSYITNIGNNNLSLQAGLEDEQDVLVSSLKFPVATGPAINAGDDFRNNMTFENFRGYFRGRYRIRFNDLDISTLLGVNYVNTTLDNKDEEGSMNEEFFFINPLITSKYELDSKNKFELRAGINQNTGGLRNVVNSFIPINYRSIYRGMGNNALLKSYNSSFNYTYGNWADEFLGQFFVSYNFDDRFFSTNAQLGIDYSQLEQIVLDDRQSVSFGTTLDQYLSFMNTNLKLKSSVAISEYKDIINNNLRHINSQQLNYGFEMRSAFSGFFNYTLGSSWLTTQFEFSDMVNSNTNNKSFLDLYFGFSEKFNVKMKNERYYFGNINNGRSSFYFTDLDAEYVFKPNTLSAHFKLNNLFDHSSFNIFSLTDITEFTSQTRLIPRYFLLSLDFRF